MTEPRAYAVGSSRVGSVHCRRVAIDGPPHAVVARDYEQSRNYNRPPPKPAIHQLWSEPLLHVEHPIRFFERADDALDLHDGCCSVAGVDAEHIYGPTLAEFIERQLDHRLPAARSEYRHDALDESCVPLVEQAVSSGAIPPGNKTAPTTGRLKHLPDASEPDLLRVRSFDSEHVAARNRGGPGQCRLSLPSALPDQPQELGQPLVVRMHRRDSFGSATYRPLIPISVTRPSADPESDNLM